MSLGYKLVKRIKMCRQCDLNPVYEFTNRKKLCKGCFIKYFQKKFFYTIRKFNMIKKGDKIIYKKTRDFRDAALKDLLDLLANKGLIEIINISNKRADKIATTSTLDIESDRVIHTIIKGDIRRSKNFNAVDKKVIKLLYLFLDEEILLYAKLRKLKFKIKKEKKQGKILEFIDNLEQKHPEIKRAIVNSYLELYK